MKKYSNDLNNVEVINKIICENITNELVNTTYGGVELSIRNYIATSLKWSEIEYGILGKIKALVVGEDYIVCVNKINLLFKFLGYSKARPTEPYIEIIRELEETEVPFDNTTDIVTEQYDLFSLLTVI